MSKQQQTKIDKIVEALEGLVYGSVSINIHQGVITRIDTTKKTLYSLNKRRQA